MQSSMQLTDTLQCKAQVNASLKGQSVIALFVACHRVWVAPRVLDPCSFSYQNVSSCSIHLKLNVHRKLPEGIPLVVLKRNMASLSSE